MDVNQWLLEGEPWVEYRTRLDLLDEAPDSVLVKGAYQKILKDPKISSLLGELDLWPGEALKNHKKAGHLLHKMHHENKNNN